MPVIVELLIIAADRPERSSINCILSHNGTTSKRWMYSAVIAHDTLRSCTRCLRRRVQSLLGIYPSTSTSCNCCICADWDYSHHMMAQPCSNNYPTTEHEDSPIHPKQRGVRNQRMLPSVKMTYEYLRQGCKYCFFNVFKGYWSITTAMEYMRIVGVKK